MSVDSLKAATVAKNLEAGNQQKTEKKAEEGRFGKLLEQELKAGLNRESDKVSAKGPNFAVFPVYEVGDSENLPASDDLRERGIRDTEQLIDILDRYRQGLDRNRLDPESMKETVRVLDEVSRDMLDYVNQVEHGELADLMQESLVMARVEVEKYSRGDYS